MPTDRPHKLLTEFFSGDPSSEVSRAIEAWVREDPANARILAELIMLDGLMLVDQKNQDATAILASLLESEEEAPLNLVEMVDLGSASPVSCVLRSSTGRWFAVAAALLLVCSLGLWAISSALTGGGQGQEVATPPMGTDVPVVPSVVATLTHQRDAQWSDSEFGTGEALYSGQRLILSQGSAKITTAKGTEVVLHAPCSIEMTGGDNALRLVRGELSARIETEQAKGFTVFLPQNSKLIDLGTAFRVSVDRSGQARCLVTEGKVLWEPDEQDDASALLLAGQAAQLVDGRPVVSDVVEVFAEDFEGYTSARENFNGGQHQTGLTVAHKGTLAGWTHKGYNSLHVVDQANRFGTNANLANFAAMVIYGKLQAAVAGANEPGKTYEVSFLAGPAVYKDATQTTTDDDRLVFELVRRDGSILATHTYRPGAWNGQMTLYPDRFTYRGDGSGELILRIRSENTKLNSIQTQQAANRQVDARFAGAIDDLSIRVVETAAGSPADQSND